MYWASSHLAIGYGILKYRIGDSNADNPNYVPLLYDPAKPVGQRFSQDNMPMSNIARLYHSVAYVFFLIFGCVCVYDFFVVLFCHLEL